MQIRKWLIKKMIGIINEAIELDNDFYDGKKQFYYMVEKRCNKIWHKNFNENLNEMRETAREIIRSEFSVMKITLKEEINSISYHIDELKNTLGNEEYLDQIIDRIRRKQLK